MSPEVRQSYDQAKYPPEAVLRWGGDPATLELLGESQNFVYRFAGNGMPRRILRITHLSHRSPRSIDAELEFLEYLKSEGCDVAAPIPTTSDSLIEPLGEEQEHAAVVFEEVTAPKVKWGRDPENRKIMFNLGRYLGKLHAVSQRYQPQRAERFHWFNDDLYDQTEEYFPESEPGIRNELAELIKWANQRPASRENYGLVHGDFWATNYRYDDGRVIAFDFDDCVYHWYTYDIAVAIAAARRLPEKYRKPYLDVMLDGYSKEKDLGGDTRLEVEWLGRLAAMHRYCSSLRRLDLKNLTPSEQKMLASRKREVLEPIRWT